MLPGKAVVAATMDMRNDETDIGPRHSNKIVIINPFSTAANMHPDGVVPMEMPYAIDGG